MFTPDEAAVLHQFLDRVQLKGHQERAVMNVLCSKLASLQTLNVASIKPVGEKDDSVSS